MAIAAPSPSGPCDPTNTAILFESWSWRQREEWSQGHQGHRSWLPQHRESRYDFHLYGSPSSLRSDAHEKSFRPRPGSNWPFGGRHGGGFRANEKFPATRSGQERRGVDRETRHVGGTRSQSGDDPESARCAARKGFRSWPCQWGRRRQDEGRGAKIPGTIWHQGRRCDRQSDVVRPRRGRDGTARDRKETRERESLAPRAQAETQQITPALKSIAAEKHSAQHWQQSHPVVRLLHKRLTKLRLLFVSTVSDGGPRYWRHLLSAVTT